MIRFETDNKSLRQSLEDSELGKKEIDQQSSENKRKILEYQAKVRLLEGENMKIKESYNQIYNEHINCRHKSEQLERNLIHSEENCKRLKQEVQVGSVVARNLETDLNNVNASLRSLQLRFESQCRDLEGKEKLVNDLQIERDKLAEELERMKKGLSDCRGNDI